MVARGGRPGAPPPQPAAHQQVQERRQAPDLRRGSWLARQGGAGLRCGGLQGQSGLAVAGPGSGPGPPAGWGLPRASSASRTVTPLESLTPRQGATPKNRPPGSPLSDALDDLLAHARISLKHLDSLKAGTIPPKAAAAAPPSHREPPGFWRPRCSAHLWSAGGGASWDVGSECGDDSEPSSDSECADAAWDFLEAVGGRGSASSAPPPLYPRSGATGHRGGAAGRSASAAAPHPPRTGGPSPGPGGDPPGRSQSSHRGPEPKQGAASRQPGAARAQPPPPRTEGPARGTASSGPAQRGHTAGFRFGGGGGSPSGAGAGAGAVAGVAKGPEAEITATLVAAIAGGPQVVRKELKHLLLKWHPDKAPQGDGAEAESARAEATRVLRFILQERERLDL